MRRVLERLDGKKVWHSERKRNPAYNMRSKIVGLEKMEKNKIAKNYSKARNEIHYYQHLSQKNMNQPLQRRPRKSSQELLEIQKRNGAKINTCEKCGANYKKKHTRCLATLLLNETVTLGRRISVEWNGGEWYEGKIIKQDSPTKFSILYDDPDDHGPYSEKLLGNNPLNWKYVDSPLKIVIPNRDRLKLKNKIPGDGHCMFRSFNDVMFDDRSDEHVSSLRMTVVNWFRNEENFLLYETIFKHGEFAADANALENFLINISKDGWGDHTCLLVLSIIFSVTIYVVCSEDKYNFIISPMHGLSNSDVYLLFTFEFHYDSLTMPPLSDDQND
jgi:hypothetical protein